MVKPTSYWVQQREDGHWEVRTDGSLDPVIVTKTQGEAWGQATHRARQNGGWVFLRGRNGGIRRQRCFRLTSEGGSDDTQTMS